MLLFSLCSIAVYATDVWFVSSPSLSPDGKSVAFVYDDDIWIASSAGGTAMRITAMNGREDNPRYSPDGKWIAFNSNMDGNNNIYIVPAGGGEIKQLTWHSAADNLDSWSWDSGSLFFTSGRSNGYSAFKMSINGGTPQRLFSSHYWENSHFVVQDKASGTYYFSDSRESYGSSNRKRYKGDNNPDILSYHPGKDQFAQVTTWEGKDLWPTIDGNGTLYYASDEWNGEYNLYKIENGKPKRLTSFSSSIGRPQVSADGSKVVFTCDYQLYIFDTGKGAANKVNLSVYTADVLPNEKVYNVQNNITSYDVSPDNKKLAFISRGELFVSDIRGKFIKKLDTDPKERSLEVMWLNDNKTLIYSRTWNGYPNLFTITADGSAPEKQLTKDEKTVRALVYEPGRKLAAYYAGTDELRLIDLEKLEIKPLVKDEFWYMSSPASFSHDLNYVAYTAYRNFEQDIMITNIKTGEQINLTKTYLSENSPCWSPDGKYIYFTADRAKPTWPRGGGNTRLYRIPLNKYPDPMRSDQYDAIFGKKLPKDDYTIKFDLENILFRWEAVGNISPSQSSPYVIMRDSVTMVIFSSSHEGGRKLYKLTSSPFERDKIDEIKGVTGGKIAVTAKKDYYMLSGGNIFKLNLNGNSSEKIDISFSFSRDLKTEFRQMFYEGWTVMAENYYDSKMHGTDWKGIRSKYEKYLPNIRTRDDLRTIMNDMLGELNSSHQGFTSRGTEEPARDNQVTVSTGILFNNTSPYVVERIVNNSPADNIGNKILKGDVLVSVNGVKVDPARSREFYFTFPASPPEMTLVFDRKGTTIETRLRPVSYSSINSLLYDEWIENNQKYVDRLSDNKIAYVYVKNMSEGSLSTFLIEMTSEAVDKDALILDLRYNTGGNIHDDLINFLSQKPYLEWKFRGGQMSPQPNFSPAGKPMVVLVNEQSLSDAEMTTAGLKSLNLGTIIGTETYRWIIFTSSKSLVDGSSLRLPAWGCYTLEGKDLEWEGVKPDIYVKTGFLDKVKNKDPQLDKAVEVLKKQIK